MKEWYLFRMFIRQDVENHSIDIALVDPYKQISDAKAEANARLLVAAPALLEACEWPGDYGILLELAAGIIEDRGHERHQGIARRLREKATLEKAAIALAAPEAAKETT